MILCEVKDGMVKRRSKNESFENLTKALDSKNVDVVANIDTTMLTAVEESAEADRHVDEVNDKLKKDAEGINPEPAEDEKNPVDNKFTAKLILDESIEDFKTDGRANKVYDDDEEDVHLDYDMFDFIYGLVVDCYPKPLNPVKGMKQRTFMYTGSDNYANRPFDAVNSPEDVDKVDIDAFDQHAQVSSTGDVITVYANEDRDKDGNRLGTVSAFDWIQEVCKIYEFKHAGPRKRRSSASHWEYSFDIYVPCTSNDYPMMVEEYFEELGLTMEDVMPADFCKQYRKKQGKIEKETSGFVNDADVDKIVDQAIIKAAQDNTEPLEVHVKWLFRDLDSAGLKYQKSKVKQKFMDAFDDDFDDDED